MDRESELVGKALKNNQFTIAVDLDGCLAEMGEWRGYQYIGPPIMSVVKDIRRAKRRGAKIILHTCRISTIDNKIYPDSLDTIRKWLKDNDVPVDEIWMGTGKPAAQEYWDDKAVKKP